MPELLAALAAAAGEDAVGPPAEDGRWAVHGVQPRAVVAPSSPEGAAAVLALASANGWSVEPAGLSGGRRTGRPVERVDVVLTSRRLTGATEYEPGDLTAAVGAGTTLGELDAVFGEHRQWLPLDPPGAPATTIGGVVAGAAAGPLRAGFGTPRDQVIGLTLATGDGRLLRFGGRVVKNVAGYDIARLVTGSRGTLGLVVAVNLRLRPRPALDLTTVSRAPDAAPLLAGVERARRAGLDPAALELLSPAAADAAGLGASEGWALLARFTGLEAAVRDTADAFSAAIASAAASPSDAPWPRLAAAERSAELLVRLADRPTLLPATLDAAAALAAALGPGEPALAAHAADGIVRILAPAPADPDAAARALAESRTRVLERGGTLVVARGPADVLGRVDPFGPAGAALPLMQGLKHRFDPAGVMAPGRFLPVR